MSAKSGADSRAGLASGGESACAKARLHQADSIVHLFARGDQAVVGPGVTDSGEGSIHDKTRGHRPTNLVRLY